MNERGEDTGELLVGAQTLPATEPPNPPLSGDGPTGLAGDAQGGAADAAAARSMPTRIGRHVVIEPIGEGGMGLVYSAFDPELDRKLAVKLVRPALRGSEGASGDPQLRLLREAQALREEG